MTLRLRIVAHVILFTICLIAGFAAIQISNQLYALNEHNAYRVRVGSNSAKISLEYTLAVHNAQQLHVDPLPSLTAELGRLHQGGLFDTGALLALDGSPAGEGTAPDASLSDGQARDQQWASYAVSTYNPTHWLHTMVTPAAVHAYVPLLARQQPRYVAHFTFGLANVHDAMAGVYRQCALMAGGVILLSIGLMWLLTRTILRPIRTLNEAAQDIAGGSLSRKVHVDTGDELETLADIFNEMTDALVAMKARAENANPLTKLPGNTVIREEIERRIAADTPFVAVYADLDHFKAVNDTYGFSMGDDVIKLTARILKEALKLGGPRDFLGHEGGDDFMFLTTPDKVDAIAQHICTEFDQRIRTLYRAEDLARGGLVTTDRDGTVRQFPIMTISLAGATNAHRPIRSYPEVATICAEVKRRAKRLSEEARHSVFALDRRRGEYSATRPASPQTGASPTPPQPPTTPT